MDVCGGAGVTCSSSPGNARGPAITVLQKAAAACLLAMSSVALAQQATPALPWLVTTLTTRTADSGATSQTTIAVRAFAQRFNVRHVPTVIVFDAQGEPAAEPVVGLAIADFYGAYLERAIEQGLAKVRESR